MTYEVTKINKGFTLAEVLIVLAIIGVVAAMTISTLMQKTQEMETSSKLKKVYTTFSAAYKLSVNENDTPDNWDLIGRNNSVGAVNMLNKLTPYLKIIKKCDNNEGCFPTETKYLPSGTANYDSYKNLAKAILSDGTSFYTLVYSPTCETDYGTGMLKNICGEIGVDINGKNKPNQWGNDQFLFYVTKIGVIPAGTQAEIHGYSFKDTCSNKSYGFGCTAWVIYNGNTDYLHCEGLDWGSKTKCS